MRSPGAYRELFRSRTVRGQAITGLLSQVTQGAAGIGIILVVRAHTGSLALAGIVVGALAVAGAVARPIQGRLIDRRDPRLLMMACGFAHPAALIGIVALALAHAPGTLLVILGVIAGLSLPPISTSMRVEWGAALPESERTAAYSLVYLVQELSILTGPLLLAAVIAAANASLALIAVALVAAVGTIGFARLLVPVAGRAAGPMPAVVSRLGVFGSTGMRIVVSVAGLMGGTFGALEVGIPTIASARGAPAASGLLVAVVSVGGIAGASLYGGRRWRSDPAWRLAILLAAMTATIALSVPVSSLVPLGALLLLSGIALNPALTTLSLLVDRHVDRGSVAEAFGWLSTGFSGGAGATSAIAGAITSLSHPHAAFLVAAIAGGCATALVLVGIAALRERGQEDALIGAGPGQALARDPDLLDDPAADLEHPRSRPGGS